MQTEATKMKKQLVEHYELVDRFESFYIIDKKS